MLQPRLHSARVPAVVPLGHVARRLEPMKRAARTMKRYLYGILQYARHPFTNARTEGINAKIQLIKHRARGYRNRDNFRIAILFHCGGLNMDPR